MDWKALVLQLSVIALGANAKTRVLVPYIGPAVTTTEDLLKGKSGKEKLVHATELVKIGISGANAIKPGTVDETITDSLIAHSISTVVDATNLIHKSQG